jgi:4-hydroxy-tetrahydrodipicolinate synthase
MTNADGLKNALTGISGILVTPFDAQDEISPAPLAPIVERAITAGVHILVSNGNTGEFYGLTTDEAEQMVRTASEIIRSSRRAGSLNISNGWQMPPTDCRSLSTCAMI